MKNRFAVTKHAFPKSSILKPGLDATAISKNPYLEHAVFVWGTWFHKETCGATVKKIDFQEEVAKTIQCKLIRLAKTANKSYETYRITQNQVKAKNNTQHISKYARYILQQSRGVSSAKRHRHAHWAHQAKNNSTKCTRYMLQKSMFLSGVGEALQARRLGTPSSETHQKSTQTYQTTHTSIQLI
jgi:hypothetical protein